MQTNKFDFIYSTRFWAVVISSVSAVLVQPEFATDEWYVSVGKILGLVSAGFTAVRTIDRNLWDK